MIKIAIFALGVSAIAYYSRHLITDPRSHGFYRFFAFTAILALLLTNAPFWFDEPFSPRQIISWTFLLASLFLAVHGFDFLIRRGKPGGDFEKTTILVASGAYRWIRHPLYSSLMWLTLGALLKNLSLASLSLAVTAVVFLFATAKTEERENINKFGAEYEMYMRSTKMFLPFVW